jgi:hypothetical protein
MTFAPMDRAEQEVAVDFTADPPLGMVLAWFLQAAFVLNVLLLPVSVVTFTLGVRWRHRPASSSLHRRSGTAMGGHLACTLVFGLIGMGLLSEQGLPRDWAIEIIVFASLVGPALCGTMAWYSMFRRPVMLDEDRQFVLRDPR